MDIKRSSLHVAAMLAAVTLTFQYPAHAAEIVRIGGTGATNEMVKKLAPSLLAETGVTVDLIPSLGTGGGNKAVADGMLDLCISGRALNAAEKAMGLVSVAKLRTPFALVTSHQDPNGIKSAELAQLYQSDKATWADGSPIRVILRPSNESDTWQLGSAFPNMHAAIAKVRLRADISVAATDQDNTKLAEETPGSLVGATFTQVTLEKRKLKFISIDGVQPSMDNFKNGSYPYGKTLYFVLAAKRSPTGERFVEFLRTPKGEAVLREAGVTVSSE